MKITSKSNRQIKEFNQLKKSRKERYSTGKFVIEGAKVCLDAIESKFIVETAFITESALNKYADLVNKLEEKGVEINEISDEISAFLCDTETPQGVYIVCKMLDKMQYLDKIIDDGVYLILESLQDPGNLGTIIRTADALGVDMVYLSADCADIYSPKVIRSTAGSLFRQQFCIVDSVVDLINELTKKGATTYGAVLHHDSKTLGTFEFPEFCGAVIGNEGNGMTDESIAVCNELLTIPMREKTESLNAGLAAGIIMWEMCK